MCLGPCPPDPPSLETSRKLEPGTMDPVHSCPSWPYWIAETVSSILILVSIILIIFRFKFRTSHRPADLINI